MKIAVWLSLDYAPKVGGTFSYSNRLIKAIDQFHFTKGLDVCFATTYFIKVGGLHREVIRVGSPVERVLSNIPFLSKSVKFQGLLWRIFSGSYNKKLQRRGVRLLYYSSQFDRFVKGFPFVAPHWDIAHRSTYAFPEFSFVLQESRDKYYNDFLSKALMVFAESEAGKQELLKYTFLNEERIRVVPLFAGECSTFDVPHDEQEHILNQYKLEKEKYFFYPAQFIAEKNHYNVIKAFALILDKYPDFKLVFTGNSPKSLLGTRDYIIQVVHEFGLSDKVIFGGFVPSETIYCLYKNACSLIMASYVGPTNMPPLEAMEIGCPVICSDLTGHREEMGDSAIYFEAKNVDQLAKAMIKMINNRLQYQKRIIEQRKKCTFTLENALNSINNHLMEASIIRSSWE